MRYGTSPTELVGPRACVTVLRLLLLMILLRDKLGIGSRLIEFGEEQQKG